MYRKFGINYKFTTVSINVDHSEIFDLRPVGLVVVH